MNLFVLNDAERFLFFTSRPVNDFNMPLDENGEGPLFVLRTDTPEGRFFSDHVPQGKIGRLSLSEIESISVK